MLFALPDGCNNWSFDFDCFPVCFKIKCEVSFKCKMFFAIQKGVFRVKTHNSSKFKLRCFLVPHQKKCENARMESWPSLDSAGSLNDFCGHAQIRGLIIQPRTAIRGNIHCYLTKSVSSPHTVFSNFSSLKIFSKSSIFERQFIWVIMDSGPNLVFQVSRACVVIVN